jgi:threonine dehydrogenase-like Zn-dependent dehydrogenase
MAVNYTMQAAMDMLASGKIQVKPLITRVAGLDDMLDILPRPKTAVELKTLVEPARARAGVDATATRAAVRVAG